MKEISQDDTSWQKFNNGHILSVEAGVKYMSEDIWAWLLSSRSLYLRANAKL